MVTKHFRPEWCQLRFFSLLLLLSASFPFLLFSLLPPFSSLFVARPVSPVSSSPSSTFRASHAARLLLFSPLSLIPSAFPRIALHAATRSCSGMEPVEELQRRLLCLEQRHADLRRIVHLLATHHTSPPDPVNIPLPVFKPALSSQSSTTHSCYASAVALPLGSVLHF